MRAWSLTLFACVLASPAGLARAADGDAEALFVQGNALVTEGRYGEACPKLEESERLEPAIGTRFNLADCYEHLGRTATAHTMFLDVARSAHAAGKFERERLAKERAAVIAPKLARIRLDVRSAATGLEIVIDGVVIPRAKWRDEHVLDPGPHRISATAAQHSPWVSSGSARASTVAVVTIPELQASTTPEKPAPAPPSGSSRRTLAFALGGVGATGIIVGAISAAVALSSRSRAEEICPESTYDFRCPTEAGASEWSTANTAGNVATIGFIAGGVAVAAAVVVWLTAPSKSASASLGAWSF